MDQERVELSTGRIREIAAEEMLREPYLSYFKQEARYFEHLLTVLSYKTENKLCKLDPAAIKSLHDELYEGLSEEKYHISFCNPAYMAQLAEENDCNLKVWQLLCFLAAQLRALIPYAYEGNDDFITLYAELWLQIYGIFLHTKEETALEGELREAVYWFERDNLDSFLPERLSGQLNEEPGFISRHVMEADLSDPACLYLTGEYVSENELRVFRFLNTLPEEEIEALARTFTEGYRIGFIRAGKPLWKKKTVCIRFPLGFERIVRAAVRQFADMGLTASFIRSATLAGDRLGGMRAGTGFYSTPVNRQFEYDHREDHTLFFDQEYIKRRLDLMKSFYEEHKEQAGGHGGPAVIECFGEEPFTPVSVPASLKLSSKQQSLSVSYRDQAGRLTNEYIIGSERSFTIISYPLPSIGSAFEEIFRETVRINTLDYHLYETIQQRLIDALDQAVSVHILGENGNETDLTVALFPLSDPETETIFENCVADVNIPVGEVFTTPVLKGTNGILHVSGVYLNGLLYRDLRITLRDGLVTDYACHNFPTREENRRFIEENLLFHHKTLPLGEFAIGTNTTAYRMARDYGIEGRLPILIGEKTGPHFALGDTCYSREEEVRVFNPDGKEIIARVNEFSEKRKTDPENAYFFCHTDITIPFDELKGIYAVHADGSRTAIIEHGLFTLPGTQELNVPLQQ
ncbi:MAG: aminopeptidase [Lachnospiraceae bacterium]|nr:aminopeptidase [Lachnospiraceae bacterium]